MGYRTDVVIAVKKDIHAAATHFALQSDKVAQLFNPKYWDSVHEIEYHPHDSPKNKKKKTTAVIMQVEDIKLSFASEITDYVDYLSEHHPDDFGCGMIGDSLDDIRTEGDLCQFDIYICRNFEIPEE